MLDALEAAGATATFFLVGEQVERFPEVAAEIGARGHEIALHCHRHRSLFRLTPRQLRDDLVRAVAAIGEATGRSPELYRPPYGLLIIQGVFCPYQPGLSGNDQSIVIVPGRAPPTPRRYVKRRWKVHHFQASKSAPLSQVGSRRSGGVA